MKRVLAAPDKFRGSATAAGVAEAIAAGARSAGWEADAVPLADGGEGLLAVVPGEARTVAVTGPLGAPVAARYVLSPGGNGGVAVIEMAEASGLLLAGGAEHNDAEAATTRGTGELIAAACAAGAGRIVVGCGGSATTDGGSGAVAALADVDLSGVELVIACDVTTTFVDAAAIFGPQKGADPAAVERLTARLDALADAYAADYGIDVRSLPGAGAAGGLAGGLAALGGRIVRGTDVVADLVELDAHLAGADLVITGEGRLDATSLAGKVVGGLLERTAGKTPLVVIAGVVDDAVRPLLPPALEVHSLTERYGLERALNETLALVHEVAAGCCAAR